MSRTRELLQKNGPGGYDIFVDPTALRTVTRYFQGRLQTFAGKQQTFASATPHQGGEFGKLPLAETQHVNQQYAKTQQDAVRSLQDLTSWLGMVSGALTASADVYDNADGVGG